jgi:hypothetical protein
VIDGVVREEGHCWTAHVMGGACDGPSSRAGLVGSVRMDAKEHIGSPIYLASIRMRGDEAKETVKAGHGREGGGGLFSDEAAGGGEDASVLYLGVVWLGEKGQAQWGTGEPGSHRRGGV